MKTLLISICTCLVMLICNSANAQEKVKIKDDKTKMKDKEMDMKVKDKDDKYKEKDEDGKVKIKGDEMKDHAHGMGMLPYTANYSSKFVIGNPKHSQMILDLWKDWDDNQFDRHDYMADTMVMILPEGRVIQGKAANMEEAKKYRASLTSAKSTLDAWIPLKSVDKNENWVALWGQEEDVTSDGKTQTRAIHEIWRINKDGKVDYMQQWSAVPPPPPAK